METEIKLINVEKVLTEYCVLFKQILKRNITDNDNIATGDLINSISVRVSVNDTVYNVILNCREYIKYLESGTKPHFPPPSALLKWVQEKKLPTRETTGDKKLPTQKQLAYLVGRKINEVGTKPRHNIYNTQQELNNIYIPKIEKALVEDIKNSLPIIQVKIIWN